MSAEQDRVRAIAERIAQRVSGQGAGTSDDARGSERTDELSEVRESLAELKRKLASIEEHLELEKEDASSGRREGTVARPPSSAHSPWLSGIYVPATHPSQERFGVEEAAVSELVDFFEKEKVCELEPGGKPCTHCDMCSTRGF
ncbi:MAG TPA: hypothetical protein VJS44_04935 [Pyrinomonadaceae bacterium]|nr:hypothetical protein [Pyrinomonadaceae bacterium]